MLGGNFEHRKGMLMEYRDLLKYLIDLRRLCFLPHVEEKSGCMSSYDRYSQYDPVEKCYVNWGANDDGSGYIRKLEDESIVAFECEGPGVIWRIWSALPEEGAMRIYFDDEENPAVNVPFIDWFEKQPEDIPPLNLSELSMCLSRGRNSFIPIPFQKNCRIELAPGWGKYYHFTYTRFPKDTKMPDYSERFTREGCIALAETDRVLYERGENNALPDVSVREQLLPKKTITLYECSGEGAIEELCVLTDGLKNKPWMHRQLILRIYWDGREQAAVEAPLGDFFGGSPGYAHYRSLPMSMEKHVYSCRFYMPFANGCRIEVENTSCEASAIVLQLRTSNQTIPKEALRFHAKWHRGYWGNLDKKRFECNGDRYPDWPILLLENTRGRFCGVHMHIYNVWKEPELHAESWWYGKWDKKSVDWWWGEGDEKFFVDGECFPSTFGTGSEDYIGYAWAAEPPFARFDSPFACMNAMPIDGNGHTSVMRFQVADNVPFQSGFQAFIEKYKPDNWEEGNHCLYAVTPYWYQQADTDDGYPSIGIDDLLDGYDLESLR